MGELAIRNNRPLVAPQTLKSSLSSRRRYLLLDCSGSMGDYVNAETRKIDALREIVASLRFEKEIEFKQITFGGYVEAQENIPEPSGGTPLHRALVMARELKASHIVVVSDGMPDDKKAALDEAGLLKAEGCKVDVFYVGSRPHAGEVFLKELADLTGGQYAAGDLAKTYAITEGVGRALLALPPAIAL